MPGGVCAVLDYEVEMMAEYVADMSVRVVTPGAMVTSSFRKFVTQILTSTRLPSTTILLGMNYLAKRINTLKGQGPYKASEGQVWRYLTISLLLGSKFLDDNTFQNRSWSEVSGISVAELNTLEFEWLQAMSWQLYVNLDMSKDYQAWLENWREHQNMKKRKAAQANRERLASLIPVIETDISRYAGHRTSPHSRYLQEQVAEYERYQAMKVNGYRARENSWTHNNPWNAPLTPPDSGYGTPEYAISATSANARYNDWFAQAAAQYGNRYNQAAASNNNFYPHHRYPVHYGYNQGSWDHGVNECNCPNCVAPAKHAPYFNQNNYGQPVMG